MPPIIVGNRAEQEIFVGPQLDRSDNGPQQVFEVCMDGNREAWSMQMLIAGQGGSLQLRM